MKEAQALGHVARFHRTFKLPVLDHPQIPDADRCRLRVNLLREELKELEDAIDAGDLVEVADALCDLQYVLSGAILEFGLGEHFSTLFDEVQRSNMSKVCATREEGMQTLQHYRETKGEEGFLEESDGKYLAYRHADRKVLKSVNYSPADLRGILKSIEIRKAVH